MRLRESHRIPLLLIACFVTAMLFPRACSDARLGVGALLPATAPLTAGDADDPAAAARETAARLAHEVARLREELDARPGASGPLADVPVVRPEPAAPAAVAARVRNRDASALRRSFTVDVGRDHGVVDGLPVVCGDSLVGVVVAAIGAQARVVRVDDPGPASAFPATIVSSAPSGAARPLGVARGTGERDAGVVVTFLRAGDARPGDLVVTAPGSDLVPEGLVIGEVLRLADDDRDGSWEAEVRPLRDLDALGSVLVLRTATTVRLAPSRGTRK